MEKTTACNETPASQTELITPTPDNRRQAQLLYWAGHKIADIARQLDIPATTVASWKERDKWDDFAPISKMELTLEARWNFLIQKDNKTGGDFKEIDLLGRQLERIARIKKYSNGGGNEADLNPKIKSRNPAERKPPEKNAMSDSQMEAMINGFLENMFDYQREWNVAGQHRIRNILKSRQIGATYYFALESLIDAIKTGRNQIFLSASKKQALQFRSYIVDYAKKFDVNLTGETIKLPNNAELIFLGTNSKTAQSYHGNLYFDEIFWVPRFEEIRKVASGMAAQKQYRQTYFSTPSTLAHSAYGFWSGKNFNKHRPKKDQVQLDLSHSNLRNGKLCADGQFRQIVNIYDAQAKGCTLFDIDALKLEKSPAEFEQLFMCEFVDDNESVFKFNLLQKCQVDAWEVWKDFQPLKYPLRPFGQREVWIGYDPADTGDRAALVVIAPPVSNLAKFRLLEYRTFRGMDFSGQAEQIRQMCNMYNVTHIAIDASGLGAGVYQLVRQFRPDAVGLKYTPDLKNRMVLKTFDVMSKGRFEFDSTPDTAMDIMGSFMAIKKQMTASGSQMTYVADRSEELSHADIAWATMHALLNEPLEGDTLQNRGFMVVSS